MYRQICSIGEIFKLWSADQVGAAKNMGEVRESVLKIVISLTLYDFSTNRLYQIRGFESIMTRKMITGWSKKFENHCSAV